MRSMVYCNLKENTETTVTYMYGATIYDITGELVFHFHEDKIEIVTPPKKAEVYIKYIKRLYGKQRENFKNGIFKEKISYEI